MKRILVVEDVEFNRDLVVQLLEDTYEVTTWKVMSQISDALKHFSCEIKGL
jgi:CheY-like chemotaxis protein